MKVRIAHHDPNILGIGEQQLLDYGCERVAGFASRVEDFDYRNRCLRGGKYRRMRPDQACDLFRRSAQRTRPESPTRLPGGPVASGRLQT